MVICYDHEKMLVPHHKFCIKKASTVQTSLNKFFTKKKGHHSSQFLNVLQHSVLNIILYFLFSYIFITDRIFKVLIKMYTDHRRILFFLSD